MAFIAQRHSSHRTADLEPGHYAKSLDPRADRCGWGILCCPSCRRLSTIGRNHRVSASGTVSTSFVCPHKPCGFHVHMVLAGWVESAQAAS